MSDAPGIVPNHQITIVFVEGPKNGEYATFSVPDDKGPPDRIQITQINAAKGTTQLGTYRQSAFGAYHYAWSGWDSDPVPIVPLSL